MGQIVTVADGFARNYLVPRGLAVEASSKNMKSLEHAQRVIQEKAKKVKESLQDFADRLSKITLVLQAKSGEEGKLFGSVTSMDVAEKLKSEGIEIDRKKISLEEPIKRLGTHTVSIHLHPEINTQITLQVVEE
jgi:large subunit ribosomal protein L9